MQSYCSVQSLRIVNAFYCVSLCYLIPNIIIESLPLLEKATASLPNPFNKIKGFLYIATILFWQSTDPINLLTIAGCAIIRISIALCNNHVLVIPAFDAKDPQITRSNLTRR